MPRISTLSHKGKTIILVDLSHCLPPETLVVLPQAKQLIAKQPAGKALILTDVTQATYNKEVADAMKDFVNHNKPYVKASAVVGADGIRSVVLQTVTLISRREIKTFPNREQAKEWLVSLG